VTLGGAGSTTPVTLANVADGKANNDAVNVEQMKAMGANIDSSGNITNAFVSYDDSTKNTITLKGANGSTKITKLAAGDISSASSTDAVNGSQLYQTNQNVANVAGGVANVTNTINNITNGGAGIKYFHVSSTLADSTATGTDAIAIGGNAKATANGSVALGANATTTANLGAQAYLQASGTLSGIAPVGEVSLGSAGKERRLTNLAAGSAATDAVNVSQLQAAVTTGSTTATADVVKYDSSLHNQVTLGGAGTTVPVSLTNLAAGTVTSTSHDAVNGSQLYGVSASVANALGGQSSVSSSGTVTKPSYALSVGTFGDVGSALGALDSTVGAINNTITDTTKYIKVVSTSSAAIASGGEAVAIGGGAYASGLNSLAIGAGARSQFADSMALGSNSVTSAANTISVGSRGAERRIMNVANGVAATDVATFGQLTALQSTLQQQMAQEVQQTSGVKSMLLGASTLGATVPVTNYIAVSTNVTGGAGPTSTDNALNAMAIGPMASAMGVGSLAVGASAGTFHDGSTAVGSGALAGSTNTTAIGAGASTSGKADNSVAIGYNANAQGLDSLALGSSAQTNATNSIAMGSNSFVDTPGVNSMALGANSSVTAANSVALGYNSVADRANSVSVGSAGAERQIVNVAQGTANTDAVNVQQLNNAIAAVSGGGSANVVIYDTSAHDKVTFGGTGTSVPVTLTNVAAGQVTSTSKDAVNGSQLFGTAASVAAALGGNSAVGTDGKLSKPGYTLDGTTYTDVGSALAAVDAKAGTGSTNGVAYDTSTHTKVTLGGLGATPPVTVSNLAAGVANNDAVNVQQLKAMGANVDSSGNVTNAFVAYDDTTKGKVTFGGAGATTPVVLTNVAAGQITSTSKDAVNGSQLFGTAASVAAALGGNSTVGTDGKLSKPGYTLDGTTYTDVGSALSAVDAKAGTGSANGVAYDTSAHTKVTLGGTSATTPVTVSNLAAGVANSDAVNVQQLKAMGANVDSSGNVTNAFVAYDDTTKGKVTFGGAGATTPVVLTNVAPGQITSGSKDAINGSQLFGTATSVAAALGGNSTVGTDGKLSKPSYNVDGGTYNDVGSALNAVASLASTGSTNGVVYDSSKRDMLTLGGVGATTPVTVANVAAATTDDEAVNLKQLKDAGLNVDPSGNVTNAFVAYDNLTKGTVTFNAGGAPTQLKNVAAATALTDAVNFGQMQSYVADHGGNGGTSNAVAYDDSTKSQVTLGGVGSATPVVLTNVAAGTNATDAVNYSQFSSLESQVNNLAGGGGSTYINIGTPAAGTTGTAAAAAGTDAIAIGNGASASGDAAIAIGARTKTTGNHSVALGDGASAPNNNSVVLGSNSTTDRDNSVSVGSAGNERQITNVAAGTQATDAVNVGQLSNAIGGLNNSISNVDRSASKGIASASALNIVTPYLPGRTTLNAGVANYRGYQALGIGVSRWNEKGTINYNLGVSSSGGNSTIVRAGIGIVLGN
ncbi:YadA family autotransporter adhesin, partial [Paraburkholderia sp. GAS38]|uniref:YadA family autotransporter adhesin n=1 Tax=Paraburkholderia sp. GAS38 TaxID=3035133 RepID=UPI003D198BBE